MIAEFIVLVTEYCIIPIALWGLPFFFKAIDSLRGSKRPGDVSEYGFEFILIESLCYLTFFLRTAFSHGEFDKSNIVVSLCSSVFSCLLFGYFIFAVFGFNKSIKFKTVAAYRAVLYVFYWSLLLRVVMIFIYVFNSMILIPRKSVFFQAAVDYQQLKLFYIIIVSLIVIWIVFDLFYKSLVEIFFIRWPRTMHEHNRLIDNGSFKAAMNHCHALLLLKYLGRNRDTITGLSQAVRGYAESLVYMYMENNNKRRLRKALKVLNAFANNASYSTGGYFRMSTINRLRIFCYLELGLKEKAGEILDRHFNAARFNSLRKQFITNVDPYHYIGFIKNNRL